MYSFSDGSASAYIAVTGPNAYGSAEASARKLVDEALRRFGGFLQADLMSADFYNLPTGNQPIGVESEEIELLSGVFVKVIFTTRRRIPSRLVRTVRNRLNEIVEETGPQPAEDLWAVGLDTTTA